MCVLRQVNYVIEWARISGAAQLDDRRLEVGTCVRAGRDIIGAELKYFISDGDV